MKELGYLPSFSLATLVIESASGVTFSFQVGGSASWRRSVQGIVYPIAASNFAGAETLGDALHEITYELIGITEKEADKIDALFDKAALIALKVDRSRLSDSCDQWIHMTLLRAHDAAFRGFDFPLSCVLTW
jgi:hypothetical protein